MRDNLERFIESNTENSWLRYLNNMCIQGTWADALIIQAVADALKVAIQSCFLLKMFLSLTTKTLTLFLKSTRHFLGFFGY